MVLFASILGCEPEPAAAPPPVDDVELVAEPEPLDAVGILTRLSLDLRGVRPTLAELADVQADPAVLDGYAEAWTRGDAFGERVAWWWNDALHTAVWADDYTRFDVLAFADWVSIGQEPLRIIRGVVAEDLPFSDIVTTPYTMADERLAARYGVPYTGVDGGWGWTAYTDRPAAGVLSSTSLWLRHTGDITNFNRRRANTVASVFLCADFLEREGQFALAIDAADLTSVENAVRTDPACLSCHAALDPLAAVFGGFAERSQDEPDAQYVRYSAFGEDWYTGWTTPAYFGRPMNDLADLGALIAADPRFAACAARRTYEGLVHDASFDDAPDAPALIETFTEGMRVSALAVEIVATSQYRSATLRTLAPEQLHTALVDLLGWGASDTLEEGLTSLTWRDELRVLGGAPDDDTVLLRNRAPGASLQVVLDWAARTAVPAALASDRARPLEQRVLLTRETDVEGQLAEWYTRFLGVPVTADSLEVDRLYALWATAEGDAAWALALQALVRHPRTVLY
jgi:hypothetical protein